jgi:hypothetical protein
MCKRRNDPNADVALQSTKHIKSSPNLFVVAVEADSVVFSRVASPQTSSFEAIITAATVSVDVVQLFGKDRGSVLYFSEKRAFACKNLSFRCAHANPFVKLFWIAPQHH